MVQRRQFLHAGAWGSVGLSAWALPSLAQTSNAAQTFPKAGSTLKYVVPFGPGGLTDVMARIVGQKLSQAWGVSVVVENKAGGNGQIGAEQAAKSTPDGNTILAITLTHAANVTLFPKAPYSFSKDLRPVTLLAGSPMLIVVPANSAIKDFKQLQSAAKGGKLTAGSSGNGTPPHLTMALFNKLNQSTMTHVPYKGGAQSISDLMGGQLDVIFSNFPESIAQVKGGKLRALALCSSARHPMLPDVPTTAEAGMQGLQVENWTAAMVPSATPDAIVEKMGREMIKIMFSPEVEEKARQQGFTVTPKGPQEFATFLQAEITRWAQVIKEAKIEAT